MIALNFLNLEKNKNLVFILVVIFRTFYPTPGGAGFPQKTKQRSAKKEGKRVDRMFR